MKKETGLPLKEYLENHMLVDFDDDVDYDTNLFDSGFIDSYGVIELVSFLEETYNVKLINDDINSPLFSSFNGLVELVDNKINKE